MKKRWLAALGVAVMICSFSTTAFAAAQYKTPAEAVAGLTGRTVKSVAAERRDSGKSYGTIAHEAGVLDSFQKEILEQKKDNLAARVKNGSITQAQADAIIKKMQQNQLVCDGTGTGNCGLGGVCPGGGAGLGNGGGNGVCDGTGNGGCGMGNGGGNGNGGGGRGNGGGNGNGGGGRGR